MALTLGAFERPVGLALRVGAIAVLLLLLTGLILRTQYFATAALAFAALLLLSMELLRYATNPGRALIQVIEALGQGDLLDRPRLRKVAMSGHDARVVTAIADTIERLLQRHGDAEAERARLTAIVEHAPTPLLAIEPDGRVTILNRAARRLFGRSPPERRAELFGLVPELAASFGGTGGRRLVTLGPSLNSQRCIASIAKTITARGTTALVSLQSIQSELEASEVKAWESMTRVLAHEIMNSLTPVASLAQTASHMLADLAAAEPDHEEFGELGQAIDAIHRRSFGLIRFIEAYRRFAEPPMPDRRMIEVAGLLDSARLLALPQAEAASVAIEVRVEPAGLTVSADPDLVEQALLNLMRNAIEAAGGGDAARVSLTGALDAQGRVAILVADTGPGLPAEIEALVFVPFFTTKAAGSGIGLSVVRQIMLAHGGTVEPVPSDRGAIFRLRF